MPSCGRYRIGNTNSGNRMNILEDRLDCVQSISIIGRLDAASFHLLEERLAGFLKAQTRFFIVDCSQLNYLSSMGLRVLLGAAKKVSPAGGVVTLWGARDHVREVIKIAGLAEILKNHLSRDQAEAYLMSRRELIE